MSYYARLKKGIINSWFIVDFLQTHSHYKRKKWLLDLGALFLLCLFALLQFHSILFYFYNVYFHSSNSIIHCLFYSNVIFIVVILFYDVYFPGLCYFMIFILINIVFYSILLCCLLLTKTLQ